MRQSWTWELTELSVLSGAVAAVDLVRSGVRTAGIVLAVIAVVLVVTAVVTHRPRPAPVVPPPRMWRVRAAVRDSPGGLAGLAAELAARDVNILSVQVHLAETGAVDEFLVSARRTAAEVADGVRAGGGWAVTVTAADHHDLVDVPTRILLGADDADLGRAARTLLGECELGWDDQPDGAVMRFGRLTVRRDGPEFTAAEHARMRALLDFRRRATQRGAAGLLAETFE